MSSPRRRAAIFSSLVMLKTYGGSRLILENSRIAKIVAVKLHATGASGANTITAYGDDYVAVNGTRRDRNVIVTAGEVRDWNAPDFEHLSAEHFAELAGLGVEIVLLGTGSRQRFPHPRLTAPLGAARVGLEVMDTKAACRTYNILVAEERRVALALLFG